jgi:DMSO/TMAO reductase YedYZ molybdopterin-dependent catalytic subunit
MNREPNPVKRPITRRALLTGIAGATSVLALPGCDRLGDSATFRQALWAGESLTYRAHRLLIGPDTLAPEFTLAERSPRFRTNGNTMPRAAAYQRHLATAFADWRLRIDGLVQRPLSLSMPQLLRMPQRTQVTRHDCVEGWSAIAEWQGTRLAPLLTAAGLRPEARFIVFHCADDFGGTPYYESIDLVDAFHPQTILAHRINGEALPVAHGAPLRLRVERQLGYKQAKYVMRIEAVASLRGIGAGQGGYWEDRIGYEWYAGI